MAGGGERGGGEDGGNESGTGGGGCSIIDSSLITILTEVYWIFSPDDFINGEIIIYRSYPARCHHYPRGVWFHERSF
jgi:hypothetical protein